MRYEDLTNEDLKNLNVNMFGGNPKVNKKQSIVKRTLKKIAGASLLAAIGAPAGPVGIALGAFAGAALFGKKFKNVKVKGKDLKTYMQDIGIEKDLNLLFDRYFSTTALKDFLANKDEIATIFSVEMTPGVWGDAKDRDDVLSNTRDYVLRPVKLHLDNAGEELLKIADKYNLKPHQVSAMFELLYDEGPLNYFMLKVTGTKGLF